MKKANHQNNKRLMWVDNQDLVDALLCRDHKIYKEVYDMGTYDMAWVLIRTKRLEADIERYKKGTLRVNARRLLAILAKRNSSDE